MTEAAALQQVSRPPVGDGGGVADTIHIAGCEHDRVIDVAWGRGARDAASTAGVDVRWVEMDTAHDVDMLGARAMAVFLAEVLDGGTLEAEAPAR